MISDDELRNELRKFGESNVPKITDKNREIHIKKLNHYRARHKLEVNPSKQALHANMSKCSNNSVHAHNDEPDVLIVASSHTESSSRSTQRSTRAARNVNNYDDSLNNMSGEYVQVNNAHTSPMSDSILNYNHDSHYRRQPAARYNNDTDVLLLDGRETTPPKSPSNDLLSKIIFECENPLF
jgi:hypothetical protein